jgi:hypothetical protein
VYNQQDVQKEKKKNIKRGVPYTDESNDQCQTQNSRLLAQTLRKHRVLGSIGFPEAECYKEYSSENQRCEDMGTAPLVLITTPFCSTLA